MSDRRIAIIGAGPGGLTLARILYRNDIVARIFEREKSADSRTQGGSLDIHADTGQYALHAAGLTENFQLIARYEDQETRIYDKHACLVHVDTDTSSGDRPEVDRGQLRQMLLDSLPDEMIRWDHDLATIQQRDSGAFELVFKNGTTEQSTGQFDLVIGADGAWSRTRPLVSDVQPIYSGIVFVELGIGNIDNRFPGLAELAGHGLTFALGDSKAIIMHRDANAHLGIYAALRGPEDWASCGALDLSSPKATRISLAAHFSDWSPAFLALIENAGDKITPRAIHTLSAGHRWPHRPGITLLGDAAHLMSPFTGEGANLAMRDAADLADALIATSDCNAAIANYEAVMLPRAAESAADAEDSMQKTFAPNGLNYLLQVMQSHRP